MHDARMVRPRPRIPHGGDLVDVNGELGHDQATSSISLRGQPMSPTHTVPVYWRDAGFSNPDLGATNVTVWPARTQAPSGLPVSQSIPLGTSTASTGDPWPFMNSIHCASRGGDVNPVPNSASTTMLEGGQPFTTWTLAACTTGSRIACTI